MQKQQDGTHQTDGPLNTKDVRWLL
jgi:hypothetical protein